MRQTRHVSTWERLVRRLDRWRARYQHRAWRIADRRRGTAATRFIPQGCGQAARGGAADQGDDQEFLAAPASSRRLSVDLGNGGIGGLAMVGRRDANLESSSGLVGTEASSHCLPSGVSLHGQHVGTVVERAARSGIRQEKRYGSAQYGFAVFMQDLHYRFFRPVFLDVVDGALAFLNNDLDFGGLRVSGCGEQTENGGCRHAEKE